MGWGKVLAECLEAAVPVGAFGPEGPGAAGGSALESAGVYRWMDRWGHWAVREGRGGGLEVGHMNFKKKTRTGLQIPCFLLK